jgi:hypothetical protein
MKNSFPSLSIIDILLSLPVAKSKKRKVRPGGSLRTETYTYIPGSGERAWGIQVGAAVY